ncbi:MAG TPA: hypothetical protein VFP54_01890 [Acidimicrobiales bacterium]|nr:hypothetical protein [Acidimicrobiales bacterium]
MPILSFDGETEDEIVRKVRRWLSSTEHGAGPVRPDEVIERAAELTKDALSIIAAAAPGPVAHSDVMAGLAHMGYELTDQTKRAALAGLNAVSELSGGGVIRRIEGAGRAVTYEMGSAVARQLLRTVTGATTNGRSAG